MNFGKWIVVTFILFAGFIATLVTVCVREEIPLVTKEYYREELDYQQQIARKENANSLASTPTISVKNDRLQIDYDRLSEIDGGQLKLFRPSNPALDENFSLEPSSTASQVFDIKNPVAGLYRASMTWKQDGKEFYVEKIIVL